MRSRTRWPSSVLGFGLDELRKAARDLLAVIERKVREIAEASGMRAASAYTSRGATCEPGRAGRIIR